MIDGQQLKHEMQTRAYASVPFPIPRAHTQRLMNIAFKQLLGLPLDTLRLLKAFEDRPEFRGGIVGLAFRDPKEPGEKRDNKVFFHYNLNAEKGFGHLLSPYPVIGAFFEELRPIYAACVNTFQNVIACFEDDIPGITASFFPANGNNDFYLRVLGYLGTNELARPHLDLSGITLAIDESDPGLFMGLNNEHSEEITAVDGRAMFMAGLTFPEETGSSLYVPTWHGVRKKTEHARAKALVVRPEQELTLGERISRMAVVCFGHGSKRRSPVSHDENHHPHPLAQQRIRALYGEQLPLPLVAAGE